LGVVGSCLYIAGFALPLQWDILPLLVLALFSAWAALTLSHAHATAWAVLALLVVVFLAETAVSTLLSVDISRSIRLGMQLLPAALLFFLITEHFDGPRDIRLLYLTLSILGVVLASRMLWNAWHAHGTVHLRVTRLGIPLLVDPNDLTFLAIIAPLSLVLLYREARQACRLIAGLSIFLSLCAACVFRSRTAVLTMIISLTCITLLTQRRRRLVAGLAALLALLLLVLLLNVLFFPNSQLVAKVMRNDYDTLDGRTPVWSAAWTLFLNAPVVGHGPHTFGVFSKIPYVHNLYLEMLAERGGLGLAILGVLIAYGLAAAWRLKRVASSDATFLGAGALAGLVGFCSAAMVDLSFVHQWVAIILFVLLGVIARLSSLTQDREVKQ
jgi:O-antigen ligase